MFDAKVGELVTCPIEKLPRLNLDIQRWRVAVMLLKERDKGKVNPKIYNEMSLLNRMAKQVDFDDVGDDAQASRMKTATEKLEQAGITSAGARAVVQMFEQTKADVQSPEPDPDAAE